MMMVVIRQESLFIRIVWQDKKVLGGRRPDKAICMKKLSCHPRLCNGSFRSTDAE